MEVRDPIKMMAQGQITKAVDAYRVMLEKHAPYFSSAAAQSVLGTTDFAKEQFKLFRTHVEARSTIITRTAPVDRTRTPKEAMVATGRTPYLNDTVVADVSLCTGDTVTKLFYRFGRRIACEKLDDELATLGLELDVDPIGLAAVNEASKEFADTHPNGTQWKNANGDYCSAFFVRWNGEREVDVDRHGVGWRGSWWFSVRCK